MGFADGKCDFCLRENADDQGNDVAKVVAGNRFWCGQCGEGRQALYGHLTDEEIRAQIAEDEQYLAANPIWPHAKDPSKQPDDFTTHLKKLRISDRINDLKTLLAEREQQKDDQ